MPSSVCGATDPKTFWQQLWQMSRFVRWQKAPEMGVLSEPWQGAFFPQKTDRFSSCQAAFLLFSFSFFFLMCKKNVTVCRNLLESIAALGGWDGKQGEEHD